jgi:hypothetical protein
MRRFVRSVLLLVGLGGCAEILGLERPQRAEAGAAGGAGVSDRGAGRAGADDGAGADHGAGAGEGGRAGEGARAGAGGAGGATPADGGSGGRPADGGGSGDGADSGGAPGGAAGADDGGAAGASDPGPRLGAPCDGSVDFACTALEPNLLLLCLEGTWAIGESCFYDSFCDPERSECRPVDFMCTDRTEAFCDGRNELVDCGANRFEPPHFVCPFGCEAGRCRPGSGDELIVHTERVNPSGAVGFWREPIPVCFHDGGEDSALVAVIRDEVERSWGFLLDIEFTGWSVCSGEERNRRVELAFLDDCELRLGGPVLSGAPADGEARSVELCRTYYTAAGQHEALIEHEALLRFVARHQFGHVLGSADIDDAIHPVTMRRWLRASDPGVGITFDDVDPYRLDYGQKLTGSLVTPSGACLSPEASGFRSLPCSHPASGFFNLAGGQVESSRVETPGCLRVPPGEAALVSLGACGDPSGQTELHFTHVRWGTPDLCVAPERAEPGSPLAVGPCAPAGDPTQAWWFEILAADFEKLTARLRFGATGDCVGLLEPAQAGVIPKLDACADESDVQHRFFLWLNGVISHAGSGLCPRWDVPRGVLYFDNRCDEYTYWISGALETPDGRLLSFTRDGELEELRAISPPAGALPLPSQIFGWTF